MLAVCSKKKNEHMPFNATPDSVNI